MQIAKKTFTNCPCRTLSGLWEWNHFQTQQVLFIIIIIKMHNICMHHTVCIPNTLKTFSRCTAFWINTAFWECSEHAWCTIYNKLMHEILSALTIYSEGSVYEQSTQSAQNSPNTIYLTHFVYFQYEQNALNYCFL